MVSLQGMPPLPRCFSGLLGLDSAQWRETERIHAIRTLINSGLSDQSPLPVCNGVRNGEGDGGRSRDCRLSPHAKLGSALTHLRQEMVHLRQLDMSLLCQLWTLHEAIQDYKILVNDRQSETNSECSYSIERDLDSIASVEDFDDYLSEAGRLSANSLGSSTSSLLQQINQLKQKVDSEFD